MTTPPPESTESATKIHPVVEFIHKEWRVIKSPSFWIAVGIIAIGIFWLEERHYNGTLAEKGAMIQRAETDRDSYKVNWDESKQEVVKLRASIPSGYVTQIVESVSSITNISIITQLVSSVGSIEGSRFVSEKVTNLVDGQKIILGSEPIPQTVKIWARINLPRFIALDDNGVLDGKVLTLTNLNDNQVKFLISRVPSGVIHVEYVRKISPPN